MYYFNNRRRQVNLVNRESFRWLLERRAANIANRTTNQMKLLLVWGSNSFVVDETTPTNKITKLNINLWLDGTRSRVVTDTYFERFGGAAKTPRWPTINMTRPHEQTRSVPSRHRSSSSFLVRTGIYDGCFISPPNLHDHLREK